MRDENKPVRVLYSFPLKLGADRICTTAWHQVDGLATAGAEVTVFPAAISRPLPSNVRVRPTLARGKFRVPNRLMGRMHYARLHDWIVSRRIEKMAGQIDIIHTWPLGALQTLKTARRLGIPTVLERCNAHTRFAYEVVNRECARLGVALPPDHEHAFNKDLLEREEQEYQLADRLLCPSDFVVKTFVDQGFSREQLIRHIYGFDEKIFYPDNKPGETKPGLTMISVGVCAVRKGLHFALEAWLKSPASQNGTFLIAGEFLPEYQKKLAPMLAHPSIKMLGHRNDVPQLLRRSDILVLPSIEEGFGLVCTEAMASGCVPLVSDACTDLCRHMENSLVHHVGDVAALTQHITILHENRVLLEKLRAAGLKMIPEITWDAAGVKLLQAYCEVIAVAKPQEISTGRPSTMIINR
ncbi:MAG TPA: glycosyltransferase family 4 protein [Verrucomicrobiae bacterium]|jgi:glycosyltransferase involved in cell wall biosynthesis|nr:glycosyltransferase family 4 protein [Verrucomicrobiae bacterium]